MYIFRRIKQLLRLFKFHFKTKYELEIEKKINITKEDSSNVFVILLEYFILLLLLLLYN